MTDDELLELLSDAVSEPPPDSVRASVLARIAASPRARPDRIGPTDVVARCADDLERVLTGLSAADWDRPALAGLTVKALIGHVIGADRYLGAKLGFWPDETVGVDELDHLATSAAEISAAEAQSPEQVLDAWKRGSGELLGRLASLDATQLAQPCRYNSLAGGTGTVLVGRAFELWTHTEDICRATGRALVGLDPERLGAMTQVAAELVAPGARIAAGREVTGTVRLVLTGPGGGTWNRRLDGQPVDGESHDVVLVADATELCRVVASRVSPAELDIEIVGDRSLGELVLAGLSSFALD